MACRAHTAEPQIDTAPCPWYSTRTSPGSRCRSAGPAGPHGRRREAPPAGAGPRQAPWPGRTRPATAPRSRSDPRSPDELQESARGPYRHRSHGHRRLPSADRVEQQPRGDRRLQDRWQAARAGWAPSAQVTPGGSGGLRRLGRGGAGSITEGRGEAGGPGSAQRVRPALPCPVDAPRPCAAVRLCCGRVTNTPSLSHVSHLDELFVTLGQQGLPHGHCTSLTGHRLVIASAAPGSPDGRPPAAAAARAGRCDS
ncbi:hypothetical protein J2Z21_003324 [Streptomyces griseochromogenes]|uniref:Uncharacterized protein n=1 Tax=Streptomyces griseochromogenes TaxID=68214 RepID=A0ABS4LSK2_9ACTN|nr:hypothetical protein [Streptomyces griseochromogenes]